MADLLSKLRMLDAAPKRPAQAKPEGAAQEAADGETEAAEELQTTASIEGETADTVETAAPAPPSLQFSESDRLDWPVSGDVILNYSMDQSVYFATLDQYKYNPAMIIGGEVGETITASAAGIVTNIEETAQTGTTVSLDMGNGYTAVYGQLTDVPLSAGDYVGAGETLGVLSEPTRYYSIEGINMIR